ncbi:hypothetical protein IWZ03DRAFT_374554 [Phyllosticta citriasiana]|uniref:Uncharacterized protein n=1 Tax=Phyllosticta citriasiana TaxID=595635 RepID=A0ABR1KU21_9PEZI
MSFSKPALLATAILATGALAKTDLSGCTSSSTVAYGGASIIWYVPGTGEICEALDCGGGRAPPKTTVPGCPAYSGTATYSPSFLPGYGAGATSAPVADNIVASSTGGAIAPGYAAPPAASSSGVAAIVVAPTSAITPAPVVVPSAGAPAVSASGVPVPAVKPGMSMSMSMSMPIPPHPASPSPVANNGDDEDYCSDSSSSSDSDDSDSSDSDTDDDDCSGSDVAAVVSSSTFKAVPSSAGIYAPAPPAVSATSLKAGLVATPTPARSTPLQFTGAAAGVVGVKGAMVALAGVAVAGLAFL